MKNINVWWEGPFMLEEILDKSIGNDKNIDYGVYQIYGAHPIYGSNVLLYIGKAVQQTFSTRLKQEEHWLYNQDSKNLQIYLGRLIGTTPSEETWSNMISSAESLLIYTHRPAHNSSNINSIKENALQNTHILNWGKFKSLLPEISSMRVLDEANEDVEDYFSVDCVK